MARIAEPENIRLAFWKAAKSKWSRPATRAFAANLEPEVARLSAGLADGSFPFGAYRSFRVFDPKERWIHAAAFSERVAHHAIMNLCEPVFERAAVFDSYACRKGKVRWRRASGHATMRKGFHGFSKWTCGIWTTSRCGTRTRNFSKTPATASRRGWPMSAGLR